MTTAGSYEIRDATAADDEQIRALTRRAYAEFATVMAPDAWAGFRQAMESALTFASGATRLVADDAETLIGSVLLYPPDANPYGGDGGGDAPELRLLAVSPDARGRGVGRALVDACINRAKAFGASELGLHSSRSFAVAIGMYVRMGFVRAPERDFQPPGAELVEGYRLVF